ncbi:MAG: hypothetical protein JSV04_11850 [Candidatus Heimdallarchaeota archaeon]|nr:MAG: hypothetical protein JSV04_11850 [Candidatus Heimdallarchaeota archaeon]
MSKVKYYNWQYQFEPTSVNILENEYELLLLAMLTVFGFELSVNQLAQNIKSLFIELNIPIHKKLISKIRLSIASLLLNDLIIHQKHGYVISEKGKPLGVQALSLFRQNVTDSQN